MIDPDFLSVFGQRFTSRARGERFYRAGFEYLSYAQFSRRRFDTEKKAVRYGEKVVNRWKRLYEAKKQPYEAARCR